VIGHPLFTEGAVSWILGIEDTCVYPRDELAHELDEHELTGHNANRNSDLLLARDLGAKGLRYGVSWPLAHRAPGVFDWTALDDAIPFAAEQAGLTLIIDLVHYGTPVWLEHSFADPGYPAAIEEFAAAFADRYRQWVNHFTPLNEPVTTASFCGLRGVWPPAMSGWGGWVAVAIPMVLGMSRSISAIRQANPQAVIIHVEAATLVVNLDAQLEDHAALLRMVGWLATDLLLGRVGPAHPAHDWLLKHGARIGDLHWLVSNPSSPDIIGVNYYPDLTPRRLGGNHRNVTQLSHDQWTAGLREVLTAFADRYNLPIALTETSIEGNDELRSRWLVDSVVEVKQLVEEGIDIRGYTWWPLFDFVDWSWAANGANVEEFIVAQSGDGGTSFVGPAPSLGIPADGKSAFLRRMGLVRLEEQPDGGLTRVVTPAALQFVQLSKGTA